MKILFYNWVDFLDPERRGGGVTVYQRNLISELSRDERLNVSFLCSGLSYDVTGGSPRWEKLKHGPKSADCERYEIVNSGTIAPSHHSFFDHAQIRHPATSEVFFDFLRATGPYDIVHFNNLEGVPAEVLTLKDRWPDTRVILSLHNYYPFCPQVNFWHQESAHCKDFKGGTACATCIKPQPPKALLKKAHALAYRLKRNGVEPGSAAFDLTFRLVFGGGGRVVKLARSLKGQGQPTDPVTPTAQGEWFYERRTKMINLINTYCDRVLCVSDRVCDIAKQYGIDPDKAVTSYIGSRESDRYLETAPRASLLADNDKLRLGFLGYMRADKGFFFLVDALQSLPDDLAKRVHLLVAARKGTPDAMARLSELKGHLGGLTHKDGYQHAELDQIAAEIDLGVVPSMWEDNLPQTAIELHARHVPLLTSDRGGTPELAKFAGLVFRAGNHGDFVQKLYDILAGRVTTQEYWSNAIAPMDMARHIAALRGHYEI